MKKTKKIVCAIMAFVFSVTVFGCAAKPTAAQVHQKVLSFIFNGEYTADISGEVRNLQDESTQNISQQYVNAPDTSYTPCFDDERFVDIISGVVVRMNGDAEYAQIKKDKDDYFIDLTLNLKSFAEKAAAIVISNLDKPLISAIDGILKLAFNNDSATLTGIIQCINEYITLNPQATLNECLTQMEIPISNFGFNAEMLINSFVPFSIFYDEAGDVIEGITLYPTPYKTITKSLGKLKFLTVAGLLAGKTEPMTAQGFASFINELISPITIITHVFLGNYFNTNLALVAANKDKVKPIVNKLEVTGKIISDQNFNVKELNFDFKAEIGVNFLGQPITLINREGNFCATVNLA